MPNSWKAGIAFVIIGMWLVIGVTVWPSIARQLRLRDTVATAHGHVVKVDRLDHNRAIYQYSVQGQQYSGSEIASHRLQGDRVRVYYSTIDPAVSMLRDPHSSITSEVVGLAILHGFVAVAAMVFGAMAYERSRGH